MHLHVIDLTTHEHIRLAAVLEALGDDFNPLETMEAEHAARVLLYDNLDPAQLVIYNQLVRSGVLDEGFLG
jgi:hypothetical protein